MPVLTDSDINDLVKGTLKNYGDQSVTQIAQRFQKHVVKDLFTKDKMESDGGTSISRRIMVDHSGAAKMVGLGEEDTVNIGDTLQDIDVPWRQASSHFAYERREILRNKGKARLTNLLRLRKADAMISMFDLLENQLWSAPTSAADKKNSFGVPYWIQKNATAGFNGGNPASFPSGRGGLDSSTFTRWKNYTFSYTDMSKLDAVAKMRDAHEYINFISPIDMEDFKTGTGKRFRIFMNRATINAYELLVEAQNDNLGSDGAPMDGKTAFKRNPIGWVPKLDEDTQNPIYMVDLDYFYPVVQKGDYFRESEPRPHAKQHNVSVVFYDLSFNFLCENLRQQACGYQAAA